MHEGVVVRDASGMIVYVNQAAEHILRRTRAQLIGGMTVNSRGGVHADGSPFAPTESAAMVTLETGRLTRRLQTGLLRTYVLFLGTGMAVMAIVFLLVR